MGFFAFLECVASPVSRCWRAIQRTQLNLVLTFPSVERGFSVQSIHIKNMHRRKLNPEQAFSGCKGQAIFVGYKILINKETT
jgi:hypothetical protein